LLASLAGLLLDAGTEIFAQSMTAGLRNVMSAIHCMYASI
jgi:hypothetical protein